MRKAMIEPSGYDRCRSAVDRAFDLFLLSGAVPGKGYYVAVTDLII